MLPSATPSEVEKFTNPEEMGLCLCECLTALQNRLAVTKRLNETTLTSQASKPPPLRPLLRLSEKTVKLTETNMKAVSKNEQIARGQPEEEAKSVRGELRCSWPWWQACR